MAANTYRTIVELLDRGARFAVAVVLKTEGSTPCKARARAILDGAGTVIAGTVGGGLVERETQRRAAEALRTGRPVVFDFNLEGNDADNNGAICGGAMCILVDPTCAQHRAAYAAAATACEHRRPATLVTTVQRLNEGWSVKVEFLAQDATQSVVNPAEDRGIEVLQESLSPKPLLLIAGGGHVGQAVAVQARLVGFDIVVIDDRPEFTRPELFPEGVAIRLGDIAAQLDRFPFDTDTYVVIVTRSHPLDADVLAACLRTPAAYIGMIGSRRKVAMLRQNLVESGQATEAELDRVYAPIGLDIGAATVPEIAASIVAQLIAVRRRR